MRKPASIEALQALFDYEPDTGRLVWKQRDRSLGGKEAGGVDARMGYRRVRVAGRLVLAHRIAIALTLGEWPAGEVDHINGDRSDNRLANLRAVLRSDNAKNKARYSSNQSGAAGVYWHKQHRKWCAAYQANGKRTTLGLFASVEEAKSARIAALAAAGFHSNHGRERAA